MTENFPKLIIDASPQIWEAQGTPSKRNVFAKILKGKQTSRTSILGLLHPVLLLLVKFGVMAVGNFLLTLLFSSLAMLLTMPGNIPHITPRIICFLSPWGVIFFLVHGVLRHTEIMKRFASYFVHLFLQEFRVYFWVGGHIQ